MITEKDLECLSGIASTEVLNATVSIEASSVSNTRGEAYNSILRVAAFLGEFDPLRLISPPNEDMLRQLLKDCTVSTDGQSSRWQLKAVVRSRVLAQLARSSNGLQNGAEEADLYLKKRNESPDQIASALINLARGILPDHHAIVQMSQALSTAYQAVLGWFEWPAGTSDSGSKNLLVNIKFEELLEPFRFLTGYNADGDKDLFVGREVELRQLRSFVDVLQSKTVLEAATRGVTRLFRGKSRTMFVTGIGGVGKSTLISKFILQHVSPQERNQLRFAYLDFDRSTISAAQPATLLLEMMRQLSWQVRQARETLNSLRDGVHEEMNRVKREVEGGIRSIELNAGSQEYSNAQYDQTWLPSELLGESALFQYMSELDKCLGLGGTSTEPVLLVLDTFEEAQSLGDEAVRRVEEFLNIAMQSMADLRVVIVGRDEAANCFPDADRLTLKEFEDQESRRRFLEIRGVPRTISDQVAKQVGGRPLALLLAARLVEEHGAEATTLSFSETFVTRFTSRLIEGILYERILSHIPDEDVRKVAHPGLVLRRLNSDIIASVIVPVLNLKKFSNDKSERAMQMLRRQKDLIRLESDGSVRHRTDVREQMLVLMTAEQPVLVRKLHLAAISYYKKRQESEVDSASLEQDRIEEIYHRLAVGSGLDQIPKLWIPKAHLDLARSAHEIAHPSGRGTLKIMLGRTPTPEEMEGLPDSLLSVFASRALRGAIASDAPERGLKVLVEYSQAIPHNIRRTLQPLVLDRAGMWDKACEEYLRIVNGKSEIPFQDALSVADFFERCQGQADVREKLIPILSRLIPGRPNLNLALNASLAVLRLRIRLGHFKKQCVSISEVDLSTAEQSWPIADAPTNNDLWLVTITDAIDKRGLRLFDGMPISDAMRARIRFLSAIVKTTNEDTRVGSNIAAICDAFSRASRVTPRMWRRLEEPALGQSVVFVMRHVMRPVTPQWYVPLACAFRQQWGQVVKISDFHVGGLPTLPFEVPTSVRTTKALADYFAQLDQLGILTRTVEQIIDQYEKLNDCTFFDLVVAYRTWRRDMFHELDPLLESLLRPKSERVRRKKK